MKTCPYCKKYIEDHWKYCPNCNKPLITNIDNDLSRSSKHLYIEPLHSSSDLEEIEESNDYYGPIVINNEEIDGKIQKVNKLLKEKESLGDPIPGSLLLEKSSLYYKKRDLSNALKNLELASKNFKQKKDLLNEAICYNEIGIIQEDLGFFDQAIYHFNRALEILKGLNDYQKVIKILNNLGNVYHLINDIEHSYKYYQEALNLSEEKNLISEEIKSASNLVEVLLILKDAERIKKILSRNSKFFKKRGDIYGMIQTHIKYGKLYYLLGEDFERAFESLNNALGLINRIGDNESIFLKAKLEWECFLYLGKLHIRWGNTSKAESLLLNSLEAIRIFEMAEDIKEGLVLESLAKLYESKREYSKSIEYYNFSIEIYEKYGDKAKIAEIKTTIAHIYLNFLDNELEAINLFEDALELFENLKYIKKCADILQNLGDIAVNKRKFDLALNNFERARSYYKELQDEDNLNIVIEKLNSLSNPNINEN